MFGHSDHDSKTDDMSSHAEIILYDIPTKDKHPRCWSLNPWKARMALNYKKIPYKTEWVEYPDIAPKFKELGIQPNTRDPQFQYSCPAARMPDGSYIMDSRNIAEALDRLQPQPSLHMSEQSHLIDTVMKALGGAFSQLRPMALPRVPTTLLSTESSKYFFETRMEMFGMSLPDLAVTDGAQHAIRNAEPYLEELKRVMMESKMSEGPYVMGREVSFADFVLAGAWSFLSDLDRRVGNNEGDLWGLVKKLHPEFEDHFKACQPFMEKND